MIVLSSRNNHALVGPLVVVRSPRFEEALLHAHLFLLVVLIILDIISIYYSSMCSSSITRY